MAVATIVVSVAGYVIVLRVYAAAALDDGDPGISPGLSGILATSASVA
ncbi:hypothetical protein [Pseudarthrobacter sp. MM222]|nr:hypothetical protein [Pseudarthrobacter sp. MM222]